MPLKSRPYSADYSRRYYAFAVDVLPGLNRLSDAAFADAMNHMNEAIVNLAFTLSSRRLLRQYLPRTVNMRDYNQTDLDTIADELNEHPRQTLDFATPSEQLTHLLR
jgi:hypothetical protein